MNMIVNYLGESVEIHVGKYYDDNDQFDIVTEGRQSRDKLVSGEVRSCYFKTFPEHQDRPGLIIHLDGKEPLVMVLGSTKKDKKWQKYDDNILIYDLDEAGLERETYADTGNILTLKDVNVGRLYGKLSDTDYDRIVKPTLIKMANDEIEKMFLREALTDFIDIETLCDDNM